MQSQSKISLLENSTLVKLGDKLLLISFVVSLHLLLRHDTRQILVWRVLALNYIVMLAKCYQQS